MVGVLFLMFFGDYLFVGQQSQAAPPGDRLGAIPDAEFAEDMGGMSLDGTQGDVQMLSDLAIGQSFSDQAKHFQFTITEGFDQIKFWLIV
jgi:hypothetical protein